MKTKQQLPVAIIGAGPVGLAAAAHLTVRNTPFILFEAGSTVGSNILSWSHVRMFSHWKYNLDKAAVLLLEKAGWVSPDEPGFPTGKALYDQYLEPFSALPNIKPFIHLNTKVQSIGRQNFDKMKSPYRDRQPFVLQVQNQGQGVESYEASAVFDASGTWNQPNPMGSGGTYALGEVENASRIFYGIPDLLGKEKERYKNKSLLVAGSGHSSLNVLLELDKLKDQFPETQISWALRKENLEGVYGGQEKDALQARGALGLKIEELIHAGRIDVYTPFYIEELRLIKDKITIIGRHEGKISALPGIDLIISNTGSRPDFSMLREIRLDIDSAIESATGIAALIDPNIHSCSTVRAHGEKELRHHEKDFYIIGSKSYGRAPTFLMATGYEQVRSVVAALAGDWESARKVELELPQTGVCSSSEGVACCVANTYEPEQSVCCV